MVMNIFLPMVQTKSKLEIKNRVWNGLNVGPQDKIRVYGKLDNEPFEKPELEVISVEKAQ